MKIGKEQFPEWVRGGMKGGGSWARSRIRSREHRRSSEGRGRQRKAATKKGGNEERATGPQAQGLLLGNKIRGEGEGGN